MIRRLVNGLGGMERVGMAVKLWTGIQELLGSNLDLDTDYPDQGFS
jgi:hypothetical protein